MTVPFCRICLSSALSGKRPLASTLLVRPVVITMGEWIGVQRELLASFDELQPCPVQAVAVQSNNPFCLGRYNAKNMPSALDVEVAVGVLGNQRRDGLVALFEDMDFFQRGGR